MQDWTRVASSPKKPDNTAMEESSPPARTPVVRGTESRSESVGYWKSVGCWRWEPQYLHVGSGPKSVPYISLIIPSRVSLVEEVLFLETHPLHSHYSHAC